MRSDVCAFVDPVGWPLCSLSLRRAPMPPCPIPRPRARRRGHATGTAIALEVLPVDPGLVLDSRAFAILHASIHDAVNGIDRRYQPYTADLSSPGPPLDAAVAAAARDVLRSRSRPASGPRSRAPTPSGAGRAPRGAGQGGGHRARPEERRGQPGAAGRRRPRRRRRARVRPDRSARRLRLHASFDAPPMGPIALFPGWGRVTPFAIDLDEHHARDPIR